jgi:hypothetical protein
MTLSPMNVLTLSDVLVHSIYNPLVRERFADTDLVISCGDLPDFYLEYVVSMLDAPLYFVRGNHAPAPMPDERGLPWESQREDPHRASGLGQQTKQNADDFYGGPHGGTNLHRCESQCRGLLLAGVEGSAHYSGGSFQYTQMEMWGHVLSLVPGLLMNRIRRGRFLDVFVTHAPPWGIHDQPDPCHRGIKAFRWLIQVFKPAYHFHGHIHIYQPGMVTETQFGRTRVINTYGYRRVVVEPGPGRR